LAAKSSRMARRPRPAPPPPMTAEERAERGRRAIREDFAANRETYARLANR